MISSFAYLDAGTGSLMLQAMVGGFAGIMVLSRAIWQSLFHHSTSPSTPDDSANPHA